MSKKSYIVCQATTSFILAERDELPPKEQAHQFAWKIPDSSVVCQQDTSAIINKM